MKKKFKSIVNKVVLLILISTYGLAQFNNNYWVFGDSAGINWNGAVVSNIYSEIKGRGTSVCLNDSSGLLLYSQTCYGTAVFDRTRTFNKYSTSVPGSDSIIGEGWYHEMVILPVPDNDSMAYIFSIGVTIPQNFGLYYTLVNYKANNDSGLVIQKNVQLNSFPAFDGLAAVRHGNGRDWWLVFQRWYSPLGSGPTHDFYIYLINEAGISNPSTQSIGATHKTNGGEIFFNNQGNKMAIIALSGLFSIYNFDRCTGVLSNPFTIETERAAAPYPYYVSGAFSPDDSKMYVMADTRDAISGTVDTLYQYNLNAPNINGSKQIVYYQANSDIGSGALKLAPDGKIYLASGDEIASVPYPDSLYTQVNTHLSVINQPDSLGLACDFQPFSFYLGGARTYYGLPNNPDYELGAWVGSPCDTLSVGLTPNPSPEARGAWMQAWYNHEWNMIHVNAAQLKGKKGVLRLFDMEGRIVFEKPAEVIAGGYYTTEINMENLANGVYVVNLMTEKEKISGKVGKY